MRLVAPVLMVLIFALVLYLLRGTFMRPGATFADLVKHPRGRAYAALALGTVAVLYSLTEWFLYLQHYDPEPPPFLRIPTDEYYAWATLFGVPTIVGGWLLATGTMQLISRALGGRGRFEDLATTLAWATAVATVFTLVPDFTSSALGVYASWDPTGKSWILTVSLYLIAFVLLYMAALRVVHGLGWISAFVVGLGGFAVYQGVLVLFLR
jgi:hypothetical protein